MSPASRTRSPRNSVVKKSNVVWVHEPFNASFEPGNKHFDFDINEISYTSARAQVVTFSNSYYDVQQSIIALKDSKIPKDHTPAILRTINTAIRIGTTGLAYIDQVLKPDQKPASVQLTRRPRVGIRRLIKSTHRVGHSGMVRYMAPSDQAKS